MASAPSTVLKIWLGAVVLARRVAPDSPLGAALPLNSSAKTISLTVVSVNAARRR